MTGIARHNWYSPCLALIILCGALLWLSSPAEAQIFTQDVEPGTCTTDPDFEIDPPSSGDGVISNIVEYIKAYVGNVSYALFEAIRLGILVDLTWVLTLYIVIFGILFTFGMIQVTAHDFTMRMIKIGIIMALFQPTAYQFFTSTVIVFFQASTDDIINFTTSKAFGTAFNSGDKVFYVFDDVAAKAASGKMFVTWLAMAFTGPYGPMYALLTTIAIFSLAKSVILAIWVYLMALVVRALLFGMAPLFLTFLLFDRTRHLFDGWLNQLVNTMLQPIFLFISFTFFCITMSLAIDELLRNPVCWTEVKESFRGTAHHLYYWRFEIFTDGKWQPYGGSWSWKGPDIPNTPIFPIDLFAVLVLLILAELANRFNDVMIRVASDFAGASTNLANMQGGLSQWFGQGQAGGFGKGGGGNIGQRGVPGGIGGGGGRGGRGDGKGGGAPGGKPTTGGSGRDNVGDARGKAPAGTGHRGVPK